MEPITEPSAQNELIVLQATMRACRLCVEAGHIAEARPIFAGRASDRLMVIGQAPGPNSGDRGLPFSGPAGRGLAGWLGRAGFPEDYFRDHTYLTSLTRCFPGRSVQGEGDRPPSPAERRLCRPYLADELRLVSPSVILLVGKLAIEEFLGKCRLDDVVGTSVKRDGIHFLPLPHSSGVSRWLNVAEHQALLDAAIARLASLRVQLGL